MKILKTEKINFGRFYNFSWGTLHPFLDGVNILFGWNGSGKTTLSKIFRSLEKNDVPPGATYKIKTDSGHLTEASDRSPIKGKIRVFNEDFVLENLSSSDTIPHIFFAGKEAVDYSAEEKKLEEKKTELRQFVIPTTHEDVAKNTALLIKGVTGINSHRKELTGAGYYSSYDRDDFKKRFNNITKRIKNGEIASSAILLRKDGIDSLKKQLVDSSQITQTNNKIGIASKWLLDNVSKINETLQSSPLQQKSKRLEGLSQKQASWVKEGVSLHFGVDPKFDTCLFCDSKIKNEAELLKHFSDAIVLTSNSVSNFLRQIEQYSKGLADIQTATEAQKKNITLIRSSFDQITTSLQEKQNAISDSKNPVSVDTDTLKTFTNPAPVDATSIAYEIESHYVAERFEEFRSALNAYNTALNAKQSLADEVKKLEQKVNELKQRAKSTHEPAEKLNRLFKIAFPYREIEIVENDDSTGYALKRDGNPCDFASLSEGEKNFIALTYFIHALNDAQNRLASDGIVVIDDPVSSLDKPAIFQMFSIIVSEMRINNKRQYFLLTHNLDFFGHLKEEYRKKIKKDEVGVFAVSATTQGCVIEEIPPLLKNHRSDYYYVFSVLTKYKDKCDMADAHLMVNLLRRWLETFLEFKFASTGNFRSTLETAYTEARNLTKDGPQPFGADCLEMTRFTNHGSHGFPDTESTDDSILTNAHLRIQEAFELVRILDQLHYKKLLKSVK